MQKRSWPKKLTGPHDEEGELREPQQKRRFWREPDEESQVSVQALYHEKYTHRAISGMPEGWERVD